MLRVMGVAGPRRSGRHTKDLAGIPREIIQASIARHAQIDRAWSASRKTRHIARGDIEDVDPVVDVIGEEIIADVRGRELDGGGVVERSAGDGKALKRAAAVRVGI